ncbi:MAG TPA: SgcJ/EcaC family oxidoreductase [Spongiibacteraceae bacterium]|nr:SgcJ/EcaC family oxidoreductase [Spongiibacteraceae bacterium]HUH37467.1 SgcJ/EcaC family oxidoreductase [Spongiibacteraceae bacterium]
MSVTPQDVKAVIEKYIAAWTNNDRALLLSIFAEDASWVDPVGTPAFVGHEGIAKFWDFAHQDTSRSLTPVPHQIIACANEGILRFTMQVRLKGENKGLDLSVVDHFVINPQGKIQSAKAFWDETCVAAPEGMELFIPDIDEAYQ